MPITPTYPGLYIEELQSNARTITAAPTSVTVIIGYTHPFKTRNFGKAVQIFSVSEYEREFGGMYASGVVQNHVANAVNLFFQNGGSEAWVIGLEPRWRDNTGADLGPMNRPSATIGNITFTGNEPVDLVPMTVTIDNLQNGGTVADITVAYGKRAETYRGIGLQNTSEATAATFIGNRVNGVSSLVTVAPAGTNYPSTFVAANRTPLLATPPAGFATTFSGVDFTEVFQADSVLDKILIFNLLIVPGISDNAIWSAGLSFCERKHAFMILDAPRQSAADDTFAGLTKIADIVDGPTLPKSPNGAHYFPWLRTFDPLVDSVVELPPSGYVAGLFARTDTNRGVWKAPAGLEATLTNTVGVVERGVMTDQRHGTLNPRGVNCIRTFPGVGTVVYGARTQTTANSAFQQWRYVPVRRMALFIEQTLLQNLGWVVFEPNDEPLWVAARTSIDNFMLSLFNQGAFQGKTPSHAFKVVCDSTTTTQTDIDLGIINIVVAFAPLKPAEFVVIKIAQLAGQSQM